MKYPIFFDEIEHIVLKDNLSLFLGSTEEGIIDISYPDIVKMAGHSCAVVSGTYLMALKGLKALYGTELPKRGEIKVALYEPLSNGNTGVYGQILSNITGATENTGFGGLQGKFNRRGLLFYGAKINGAVRFTRMDTNQYVDVSYKPGKVVAPGDIMQMAFGPNATDESKKAFPIKWQEMVKTIFDNADAVIEINRSF